MHGHQHAFSGLSWRAAAGSPAALASPLVLAAGLAVSTTMSPSERVRLRSWERGNEEERRSVLCARRLVSVNEEEAPQ